MKSCNWRRKSKKFTSKREAAQAWDDCGGFLTKKGAIWRVGGTLPSIKPDTIYYDSNRLYSISKAEKDLIDEKRASWKELLRQFNWRGPR